MYCKKCGKKLAHDAKFCKYCGIELQQNQTAAQQKRKSSKFTIPVLIGIAILAIGVGLSIHLNNVNRPSAVFLSQLNNILIGKDDGAEVNTTEIEGLIEKLEANILKNVSYEVLKQEKDMVELRINAPDMSKIIYNNGQTILSQHNAIQSIMEILESGNFEFMTIDLEVEVAEDGSPKDPYALMDTLYGNIFSLMTELLEVTLAEGT